MEPYREHDGLEGRHIPKNQVACIHADACTDALSFGKTHAAFTQAALTRSSQEPQSSHSEMPQALVARMDGD